MSINYNSSNYPYNQFEFLDELPYLAIKYLMNNDEVIWKLLRYTDPDAWDKPNLTFAEKGALVYAGQEDSSLYRVFMDTRNDSVFTQEESVIRISNYRIMPKNRSIATITMSFEAYAHYKVNTLSNYKTRVDMIAKRFLQVFNGIDFGGGIGPMFFDYLRDQSDVMTVTGTVPVIGRQIFMTTNVG